MGKVKSLKGYFGNFEVKIDNFAEALPYSKDEIIFGDISQDVSSECDIFIDLSGSDPLISSHEKRDGYYKVNPEDKKPLQKLILDAQTKIGEFEKPIYVNFDENLCAHSRNKITGCSKCLEVCPANAIQINGDTVDINTFIYIDMVNASITNYLQINYDSLNAHLGTSYTSPYQMYLK